MNATAQMVTTTQVGCGKAKDEPVTGEWTGDTVISYWQPDGTFYSFYKAVAAAHNAALAAAGERGKQADVQLDHHDKVIKTLREQLAAERAYAAKYTQELREQLAAERQKA